MSVEYDEEILTNISDAIAGIDSNKLKELFKTLVDEEFQVRYLVRAHRIIRRIDEAIDNNLEAGT